MCTVFTVCVWGICHSYLCIIHTQVMLLYMYIYIPGNDLTLLYMPVYCSHGNVNVQCNYLCIRFHLCRCMVIRTFIDIADVYIITRTAMIVHKFYCHCCRIKQEGGFLFVAELSIVSMAYLTNLKTKMLNWHSSNVQWVKLLLLCMATVPCVYSLKG